MFERYSCCADALIAETRIEQMREQEERRAVAPTRELTSRDSVFINRQNTLGKVKYTDTDEPSVRIVDEALEIRPPPPPPEIKRKAGEGE